MSRFRGTLAKDPGQRIIRLQGAEQPDKIEEGALRDLIKEAPDLPRGARLAKAGLGSGYEARLGHGLGPPWPLCGNPP
jgi:hypothetical protein